MAEVIKVADTEDLVPTKDYEYANWSFENFNPVQSTVFQYFKGDSNMAIAAATSAGKTVCSEMFMAYEVRERGGKAMYVGPLKALAKEKEDDWKSEGHHFSDLNISICTGDFRLTQKRVKELDESDIIVMTPEMLASRCRNSESEKSHFLEEVGTVVFDESHLLTVPSRGDHIEVALMKLTEINPNVRIIFLSATMPNVDEICEWLSKITNRNTYYLESEYRPCPLSVHYEVYYDGDRRYEDVENQKIGTALGVVNYYVDDKFLIFVHSKKTGKLMLNHLQRNGIEADFHHADLGLKKRMELEEKFKNDKKFRVLVATSTLAWGLNLPARRVIVTGVHRGLSEVPNYDIAQMIGRAGRPAFDPKGDAYILVPESTQKQTIMKLKKPTVIRSRLLENDGGHYKTLAFHIVSEIHYGNVITKEGFHKWFNKSLAHHQDQNFDDDLVDNVIDLLAKSYSINVNEEEEYTTTPIGKVASIFYYNPFDVSDLRRNFKHLFDSNRQGNDIAVAMALADVDSFKWGFATRDEKVKMTDFKTKVEGIYGQGRFKDPVIKYGYAYHNMLNGKFDVPAFAATQATLRVDLDRTMQVILSLNSMSGRWGQEDYLKKLNKRLNYGVSERLIGLCEIPDVGKTRAERLWNAGITSVDAVAATGAARLSKIMRVSLKNANEYIKEAQTLKIKKSL